MPHSLPPPARIRTHNLCALQLSPSYPFPKKSEFRTHYQFQTYNPGNECFTCYDMALEGVAVLVILSMGLTSSPLISFIFFLVRHFSSGRILANSHDSLLKSLSPQVIFLVARLAGRRRGSNLEEVAGSLTKNYHTGCK